MRAIEKKNAMKNCNYWTTTTTKKKHTPSPVHVCPCVQRWESLGDEKSQESSYTTHTPDCRAAQLKGQQKRDCFNQDDQELMKCGLQPLLSDRLVLVWEDPCHIPDECAHNMNTHSQTRCRLLNQQLWGLLVEGGLAVSHCGCGKLHWRVPKSSFPQLPCITFNNFNPNLNLNSI